MRCGTLHPVDVAISYQGVREKMARMCSICQKIRKAGNNISHAHNITKRVFRPNLQTVRVQTGSTTEKILACTRCIRSNRVNKVG